MTSPLSPEAVAQMVDDREAGTPGPWRYEAMGGSSTVLTNQMPSRNDTRIPAYGYREENGFCLSYPFIEDDGRTRLDFTCFSHADARRISRLPYLEAAYLTLAAENATLRASEAAALERADKLFGLLQTVRDYVSDAASGELKFDKGVSIQDMAVADLKLIDAALTPTADKEPKT